MSIVAMRAGITKSYYAPLADIPVGEAGAKLMKPRSVSDGKWLSENASRTMSASLGETGSI